MRFLTMRDWKFLWNGNTQKAFDIWQAQFEQDFEQEYNRQPSQKETIEYFREVICTNPIVKLQGDIQNLIHWLATRVRVTSQDLNDDRRAWRHGRAWFWLGGINNNNPPVIGISWSIPTSFWHLRFEVGGEDELGFSIAFGLIALWLKFERFIPSRWFSKELSWQARTTGVSWHHGGLWIDIWRDDSGWSKQWGGIHWHFDPMDFLFGYQKHSKQTLYKQVIVVELPEEDYQAEVEIFESAWKRPRLPFVKKMTRAEITPAKPIPIPGKGENSWDIDDNAIYGMTCAATTPEEAAQHLKESVLRDRLRYGGASWIPEQAV